MVYKKAKFFWKANNDMKDMFCIPFNDNEEYYAFLKKYHSDGYHQIIITSEIMIEILEYFVLEKGISVFRIEFMENDSELTNEIEELLNRISSNKAFFGKLTEKLKFLSEKSSIDIKHIYFKGRRHDGTAINFYVQSNGIVGSDKNNYKSVLEEISNLIKGCLFQ